jgi:hypothetical protein
MVSKTKGKNKEDRERIQKKEEKIKALFLVSYCAFIVEGNLFYHYLQLPS